MANEIKTESRKPRRWLRWVGFFFVCMFVGLFILYFVGTSEWALKSVILPQVSKAMNASVTIDSASISPFSSVDLRGLKVQTTGTEPLVTAQQVHARYSLMDIIKGNINVSEVMLDSAVVTVVTFADGTSNLDPLTKNSGTKDSNEKDGGKEKKSNEPVKLNLQKFVLNNATVRNIQQRKDGTRDLVELTGVNITAEDIGNNKVGQLGLAANLRLDEGLNSSSNGVLAAMLVGKFNLQLDAGLKPQVAKGQTKIEVMEAKGSFAEAAGFGATLNADVTPTQLNDVSVRFTQSGKALGALTVSGPFSTVTTEGKLAIALSGIDRQVLSLAGAAMGLDFNQTAINSTNTVELTQKGRMVAVNGQLIVSNFSVTQNGQTTPVLDIRSGYALTYDQTNKTAQVQTFTLKGTQNKVELLRGTLAKPMLLELGNASGAVDESAFDLVVTNFNLPDWQAFIGTNTTITSGKVGVTLNLVSQEAGKKLSVKTELHVADLVVNDPSGQIPKTPLAVDVTADVSQAKSVLDLKMVQLALTKTERAPNTLNLAGRIDMSKTNAWTGNLKVISDGLDVTPYYDIFANNRATQTNAASSAKFPQQSPKESSPETEPPPMKLPFTQFTTEVNIAKLFLREVAISNLVSKTVIENGKINVNPFSLTLNGAPMTLNALINLAIAGYEYDVNAKLDGVPVEPLVNTFSPENRGKMKGDLFTSAQIKGEGITGKSLQKNLAGQIELTLTNANVQVTQYKQLQKILKPIALALRIPQLSESPLSWLDARANIGGGTVTLSGVTAESSVFRAGLAGTVSIAEVLTNSTLNKLPVEIALRRNIADAARVTPAGTPADAEFVRLPKFVSVAGTIGEPKTDIDKTALTRLLAGTVGNYIGGDAGKILRGLSNFGTGTSTNASGTNGASTNAASNLIEELNSLFQKPAKTNASSTNVPAKKKSGGFNLNDLIK